MGHTHLGSADNRPWPRFGWSSNHRTHETTQWCKRKRIVRFSHTDTALFVIEGNQPRSLKTARLLASLLAHSLWPPGFFPRTLPCKNISGFFFSAPGLCALIAAAAPKPSRARSGANPSPAVRARIMVDRSFMGRLILAPRSRSGPNALSLWQPKEEVAVAQNETRGPNRRFWYPCVHLPGFHFGTGFLSHSRFGQHGLYVCKRLTFAGLGVLRGKEVLPRITEGKRPPPQQECVFLLELLPSSSLL